MRVLPALLLVLPTVLSKPILVQEEATLASMPWELEHPHHPHHPPSAPDLSSDESKSIYEILEADERFSYVTKAIKFTETVDYYKDSSASLTFFAPPNDAFPHHDHDDHTDLDFISQAPLSHIMEEVDLLESGCDELDDKDKEKRRKVLKIIAHTILSYHTIPHKLSSVQLGENSTHATNLTLPFHIYGGQPVRIKTHNSGIHPILRINLLTKVTGPDVATKNGYIQVVSFPLIPPPPAFAALFWGQSAFSTFTSAIQRVSLLDALDLYYVPNEDKDKHPDIKGAKAVTVFAPINKAFESLPEKLKIFLFSPFGTRVLRKLLQYHIVPDYILLTDYTFNASSNAVSPAYVPPDHGPQPIFETKAKVPTLLANHTLDISIAKFNYTLPLPGPHPVPPRIVTKFEVDGHRVALADLPALNGAVHVIGRVLNPVRDHDHKKHPHPGMPCMGEEEEDSWEDWEDWLLEWAEEN